ncbi:MAG: hypothetical protein M1822_008279 [Bathelium mastoideum]|nr:MAG: hypothetical protein M1822_008279 [Bathelium mastoideum]
MLPGRVFYRKSSSSSIQLYSSFVLYSPHLASAGKRLSKNSPAQQARTALNKPLIDPSEIYSPIELLHHEFPRKIWQWWRHGAEIPEGELAEGVEQWRLQNPEFRYERLSHGDDETYVRDRTFWNPRIANAFAEISHDTILRSDFVRYIALLMDGGVYADIDTTPQRPIVKWIPTDVANATNLVVGIEMDKGYPEFEEIPYTVGLAQYAIMAKKGHPAMLRTVEKVYHNLIALLERKGIEVDEAKSDGQRYPKATTVTHRYGGEQSKPGSSAHQSLGILFDDVIKVTGPTAFTASVWEYLSEQTGEELTGREITNITEPILIADVLVLPINGLGSGQLHSNSGHCNDTQAVVCHHWVSSWVKDYPYEESSETNDTPEGSDHEDSHEDDSTDSS